MTERPAIEGGQPVRPADRYLVFGAPVIGQPEVDGVVDCLRRRWIGTGPVVRRFEKAFSRYKSAPHAVAVNSGTAALHLSLQALDIGPGMEVVTTPMTFCSTLNAIAHAGAKPVLADCDRRTFNVSPDQIERCLSPRTRAILVVHMCGRCCEMNRILEIARPRGLRVIEDCAHAIEARYHGVPSGLIGDVGCFSFYATKNLTTAEGGMVVTRDGDLAAEVRSLALHGLSADAWTRFSDEGYRHYQVVRLGFKYNMPDLQAAIGLAQMERLEPGGRRRDEIWRRYDEALADLPCLLPRPPEPETTHARHLYTPLIESDRLSVSRDHILEALHAENIGTGVHFVPIHQHEYYRRHGTWAPGDFPNAEFVGARTLSLPLAADLDDEAVEDVCVALRRILTYYRR